MDAIAEKQREREKEIEAKRASEGGPPASSSRFGARPGGARPPMDRGGDRFGGGDRGDRPPMDRGGDRFGGGGGGFGGGANWRGERAEPAGPADRSAHAINLTLLMCRGVRFSSAHAR